MNIKIIIIAVTTIVTVAGVGGAIYNKTSSNMPHDNVTPKIDTSAVIATEAKDVSIKIEDAPDLERCVRRSVERLGYQGMTREKATKMCKRNFGIN